MTDGIPRLRMFAGPNGSGKTTVKNSLGKSARWFGVYINPDDIEAEVRKTGRLAVEPFRMTVDADQLRAFFTQSAFLQAQGLAAGAEAITCRDHAIDFGGMPFNSYHASVLADFLRRQALAGLASFSFETVMSSPDKVELLREAQQRGFRTYLYYIATEDPAINVQRVRYRTTVGGHDVPEAKIIARYSRSLALLPEAIRFANRTFLFDTSQHDPWYFAEITDGASIRLPSGEIPEWFTPVWERFA